jgi:hypothetical protein
MNNAALGELAQRLVVGFFSGSFLPRQLFDLLAEGSGGDRAEIKRLLDEAWVRGNKARSAQGMTPIDAARPVPLSLASGQGAAPVFEPESRTSREAEARAEAPALGAAGLLKLIREDFGLDDEAVAKLNGGRRIDERPLLQALESAVRGQRLVPRLLQPYLEGKFFERFKDFLKVVVEPRDGSVSELLQHFGVYLILNGAPQDQLASMQLAPPLEAFVGDRMGRVRQIFYVALLFGYTFTYVLFAQVFEISSKYRDMAEDQRAKLRKLYAADERLALLVTNAGNVAMRRISDYGVEAREIQMALKKFLADNKRLVVASDLFAEVRP